MTFKLLISIILFSVSNQCDIEEVYQAMDLSDIAYNAKLLVNGTVEDGYGTRILTPMSLSSGIYELQITRKASNFYEVDHKDIFIETRYCYEYSYAEDVLLKWNGYSGEIIFED